jgi:hypothetical protein
LERSPPLLKKPCFPFLFQRRIEKNPLSLKKKILFVMVESYPSSLPTQKIAVLRKEKTLPNSFPYSQSFTYKL